jgi:hypothetical protein
MNIADLALWALVVALGIQTGSAIYEARVIVPLWSSAPPESVIAFFAQPLRPDAGHRLWIILTPTTSVIVLVNLFFATVDTGLNRAWWLGSSIVAVGILIATFAYFVPVLLSLPRISELPRESAIRKVRLWRTLNYFRAVLLVCSWLAALKAFSYGG